MPWPSEIINQNRKINIRLKKNKKTPTFYVNKQRQLRMSNTGTI